MTSLLFVLLAAVALGICSVRDDSPSNQTRRESLRAAGWKHIAWVALQALVGVSLVLVVTALRTGVYGVGLAIAGVGVLVASLVSIDRRPVRIHRLEIRP